MGWEYEVRIQYGATEQPAIGMTQVSIRGAAASLKLK